ncbi:MAG: TlpA disulfide reductase family protein [Lacipirellulaceae bacterium]
MNTSLHRTWLALIPLACVFTVAIPKLVAQDSATAESEATEATDEKEQTDPFEIPKGDAGAILEFMQSLSQLRPEEGEDTKAFATKLTETMRDAADAMLKLETTDQQTALGHRVLLISLDRLSTMGDKAAFKRLEKETAKARASKNDAVANLGWQFTIVSKLENWEELEEKDRQGFVKNLLTEMGKSGFRPMHAQLLQMTSESLEGIDPKYARIVLRGAVDLMKKSEDPQIQDQLAGLEGTLRRMELPGNEMEVFGTYLNGKKLDWKSYRGKVVLVDFWATWCGPCRGEIPSMKEMYSGYHDKGFEILGISLDDTAEDAQRYIKEEGITWRTLFPANEADRGWNNPMARYYGINGIPTAILIDKEGKVVHMNARGRNLPMMLKKLLGEPVAKKDAQDKEDSES